MRQGTLNLPGFMAWLRGERGRSMLYAALGDSITHGYCATDDTNSYVSRIRSALSKQGPVSLYLLAKPGWTSRQLLKVMRSTPSCIWDEARLVTIVVGGNDILKAAPWLIDGNTSRMIKVADKLYENLTEIVRLIKRPQSTIVLGTLYNPFPNSMLCEEFTDILNKSIRLVAQREKVGLADIRQQFRNHEQQLVDGYRRGQIRDIRIRGNPIHPNDHGHEAIARAVLRAYRRSFATTRAARRKQATVTGRRQG